MRAAAEHDPRPEVAVGDLAEQRDDEHRHRDDPQHRQRVGDVQRDHAPVDVRAAQSSDPEPSFTARAKTASSISSVSLPVNVFCWLGW